jgi:hypothetical protein
MKRFFTLERWLCLITFMSVSSFGWAGVNITSPNGKISVNLNTGQDISFEVSYMNKSKSTHVFTLSSVGILTQDGGGKQLKLKSMSRSKKIMEQYTMLTGKRKNCNNVGNECTYYFIDNMNRDVNLVFRVYNDGIAFRYVLPKVPHSAIADEMTTYKVASGIKRWTQNYITSYEGFYTCNTNGIGNHGQRQWGYPALFQTSESTWMLISEAGISRNNCASDLTNKDDPSCYKVRLAQNNVNASDSWASPWRVAIIGSLSDIVESTLVTDVSDSCKLKDTSWIHPGVVSWIYWAYNHGSKDYQVVKKYIDMAQQLHLPYVLIDSEWDEMTNGGNVDDAVKYALSLGVKPLLWYNSSTSWVSKEAGGPFYRLNSPQNREKEFAWLNKIGVKGIKVDFFSGDSLSTMNYYMDLLKDAAKYKLMVNFHGATIPRGWQRTYPNLMSVEAVYGAEWYNNAPVLTDSAGHHNTTLPFTRNVIGSMDYTPCTFTDSQHPHKTSNAHELALTVVFESGLQHLPDRPSAYLSQPNEVQSFISHLPTAWDNIKLLSGYPGKSVVIARRKGQTWYIGGLNGMNKPCKLPLNLSFIKSKNLVVTLFKDGKKERSFDISKKAISNQIIQIPCLPYGGFVAVVSNK